MTFSMQCMRQGYEALASTSMHYDGQMAYQMSSERNQAFFAPVFSFSQNSLFLAILIVVPILVVLHSIILSIILRTLSVLKPIL